MAALLTSQVIMTSAAPLAPETSGSPHPAAVSKPGSAATAPTSILGPQKRAPTKFRSDAGTPLSRQCVPDVSDASSRPCKGI